MHWHTRTCKKFKNICSHTRLRTLTIHAYEYKQIHTHTHTHTHTHVYHSPHIRITHIHTCTIYTSTHTHTHTHTPIFTHTRTRHIYTPLCIYCPYISHLHHIHTHACTIIYTRTTHALYTFRHKSHTFANTRTNTCSQIHQIHRHTSSRSDYLRRRRSTRNESLHSLHSYRGTPPARHGCIPKYDIECTDGPLLSFKEVSHIPADPVETTIYIPKCIISQWVSCFRALLGRERVKPACSINSIEKKPFLFFLPFFPGM